MKPNIFLKCSIIDWKSWFLPPKTDFSSASRHLFCMLFYFFIFKVQTRNLMIQITQSVAQLMFITIKNIGSRKKYWVSNQCFFCRPEMCGGNFAKIGVPESGFWRNGSIINVFWLLARRRRIFLPFYTSLMNFLIIFHRFENPIFIRNFDLKTPKFFSGGCKTS